ncbi:MAG: hypothetical protein JOZ69_02425 [Myxococcales bacterium]|nr:hypothetical protein [Myxococcales bacterium]
MAVIHRNTLVGLDLFGSPSLCERGWRKVARGFLVEVYETAGPPREELALGVVRAALAGMSRCSPMRSPAPGMGETIQGAATEVTFTGVVHGETMYHAVAFGPA